MNMTLNEAFARMSESDFEFLRKNGKRSSRIYEIDFKALHYSSWEFVKETAPTCLKSGDFDTFVLSAIRDRGVGIFEVDLDFVPIKEKTAFLLWCMDELESISEMERDALKSPTDSDLVAAGVDRLDKFGELNIIDAIASGDVLKWDAVKKLPYEYVFAKQYMMVESRAVSKDYEKIIREKSKRK